MENSLAAAEIEGFLRRLAEQYGKPVLQIRPCFIIPLRHFHLIQGFFALAPVGHDAVK